MQPGDAVPNFSSLACVNGEIVQLELASFQGLYTVIVFYEVNTNILTNGIHTKIFAICVILAILFILMILVIFINVILLTILDI